MPGGHFYIAFYQEGLLRPLSAAELSDGTLQIKSEAGKGSSFIVCLPKTAIVPKQAELLLSQA